MDGWMDGLLISGQNQKEMLAYSSDTPDWSATPQQLLGCIGIFAGGLANDCRRLLVHARGNWSLRGQWATNLLVIASVVS